MQTCLKRVLQIAAASGGMLFLGTGIAAASPADSLGDTSTVTVAVTNEGTDQAENLLSVPITINDVDVSILSDTYSTGSDTPAAAETETSDALVNAPVTVDDVDVSILSDTDSTGSDTPAAADTETSDALVNAPVTVTDVDIAVLDGTATTSAADPAPAPVTDAPTDGSDALVSSPIGVCGVAAGVLGEVDASCAQTAPSNSDALISAPINVCGVAAGVLSDANASCAAAPSTTPSSDPSSNTFIEPVTVCGISAGVLGDASSTCTTPTTPGGGLIDIPVTVCGIGVGVLGDANADCAGPDPVTPEEPTAPVLVPVPSTTSVDVVTTTGDPAAPAGLRRPAILLTTRTQLINTPAPTAAPTAGPALTYTNAVRTNGSLASTGFDVTAILPIGLALIALGGLLLLRRRQTTQS